MTIFQIRLRRSSIRLWLQRKPRSYWCCWLWWHQSLSIFGENWSWRQWKCHRCEPQICFSCDWNHLWYEVSMLTHVHFRVNFSPKAQQCATWATVVRTSLMPLRPAYQLSVFKKLLTHAAWSATVPKSSDLHQPPPPRYYLSTWASFNISIDYWSMLESIRFYYRLRHRLGCYFEPIEILSATKGFLPYSYMAIFNLWRFRCYHISLGWNRTWLPR